MNVGVDQDVAVVTNNNSLNIGGFVPLTTIDYPDHLAAVVFCQGCPFRCVYCYNKNLISRRETTKYNWQDIKNFLIKRKRRNLLEAVVFSGGEPTLQVGLINAIREIKLLGFKIGLHTCGAYPNRLKELLPYLDWVGMDIKTVFEEYQSITTIPNSGKKAFESMQILLDSKVLCEFRTTVYPPLINNYQILAITDMLKHRGANYKLQSYKSY